MKNVAIIIPGGIGNIKNQEFVDILNSEDAITFRNNLIIKANSICKKCFCSINLSALVKL